MLKDFLIVLSLLLNVNLAEAQQEPEIFVTIQTAKDLAIVGQAKKVYETCHSAWIENDGSYSQVKSEWKDHWGRNSETTFDSLGRIIKKEYFDNAGNIDGTDENFFENENLIWSRSKQTMIRCNYDESGRLIRYSIKRQTGAQQVANDNDWENKNPYGYVDFYYDSNNRVVKINTTDPPYYFEETVKYDSSGNVSKITYQMEDVWEDDIFNFDQAGNLIEWIVQSDEGESRRGTYTYSGDTLIYQIIEWNHYGGEPKKVHHKFKNSLLTEMTTFDWDGGFMSKETYEYEFDKNGSWIKRIMTYNNDQVFITERTIEYY